MSLAGGLCLPWLFMLAVMIAALSASVAVRADDSLYIDAPIDRRFEKQAELLNLISRFFPSSQQTRYMYDDPLYAGSKRSMAGPAPGFVGARGKKGGAPGFVGARGKRIWTGSVEDKRR